MSSTNPVHNKTLFRGRLKFSLRSFLLIVTICGSILALHLQRLNQQDKASKFLAQHNSQALDIQFDQLDSFTFDGGTGGGTTVITPTSQRSKPKTGILASLNRKDRTLWIGQKNDLSLDQIEQQLTQMRWLECVVLECKIGLRVTPTSAENHIECVMTDDEINRLKSSFPKLEFKKSSWFESS